MDFTTFTTIPQIIAYVKPLVLEYRKYPSKKADIVDKLQPIFSAEAEVWSVIIDLNVFKTTFREGLGKRSMSALKKLLYELDYEHYKNIEFGID